MAFRRHSNEAPFRYPGEKRPKEILRIREDQKKAAKKMQAY